MTKTWEMIQTMYKKLHGIPPRVVDYMAVEPIVKLCADGRSNSFISRKLNLDISYVSFTLKEFLRFPGWEEDLDISPLSVYNLSYRDFIVYKTNMRSLSSTIDKNTINKSFNICRSYHTIRKEIEEYVR